MKGDRGQETGGRKRTITIMLLAMRSRLPAFCLLSSALWISSCSGPRPDELVRAPRVASAEERAGEGVFMRSCNGCHPAGLGGLGPGIINKPLPGFAVRFQVRHGLGAMPAFPPRVIPPEDLSALVAYLRALRRDRGAS